MKEIFFDDGHFNIRKDRCWLLRQIKPLDSSSGLRGARDQEYER